MVTGVGNRTKPYTRHSHMRHPWVYEQLGYYLELRSGKGFLEMDRTE
jgi:hypothetical protein